MSPFAPRALVCALFLPLLAGGCSGASFDVSGDGAVVDDAATTDTLVAEVAADGSLDGASDDGSLADGGDASAGDAGDAAEVGPIDACAPNVCGGCSAITGKPGDACGVCGARACAADKESLGCSDPGANVCGGCKALTQTPGAACGSCGKLACGGDKDSVYCDDPGKNACGGCKALAQSPGAACGSCGKLACGTDAESVVCNDPGKNACGGCAALAGKPGDACGVGCGGGTYQCDGTEGLKCVGATAANACGGCNVLPHAVGSACGTCGTGSWTCDPSNKNGVVCTDSVPNAAGSTCSGGGRCGQAKWQCDAAQPTGEKCVDPTPNAPGTTCNGGGSCGKATWQCDAGVATIFEKCVDPTPNAVGTTCNGGGICGLAKWACDATVTTTYEKCVDPTPNATGTTCNGGGLCGGAKWQCDPSAANGERCVDPVVNAPGTSCTPVGVCSSAKWQCTSPTTEACVDPVPAGSPKPGATCGFCGTSSYFCNASGSDTVCAKPDDRSSVVSPSLTQAGTLSARADRMVAAAFAYTIAKAATKIASVDLKLGRYDYDCRIDVGCAQPPPIDPLCACTCDGESPTSCTITSSGANTLKLELWTGTPSVPVTLLETSTLSPTAIPLLSGAAVPTAVTSFPFALDHNLAVGTKVFLKLVAAGGSWEYFDAGEFSVATSAVPIWEMPSTGGAVARTGQPYVVVNDRACP